MARERPASEVQREALDRVHKLAKLAIERREATRHQREATAEQRAKEELRAATLKTAISTLIQKTKPALKAWDAARANTRLMAWSFFAKREYLRSKKRTAPNGNVIWLLLAIFRALQLKQSPPKWALDALSETGATIDELIERPPASQLPKMLMRAVGLNQSYCFTHVQKQLRKINIGLDMRLELKKGKLLTEARKLIAEKYDVSVGTVRNGEKYVADFYTMQPGLDELSVQKDPQAFAR